MVAEVRQAVQKDRAAIGAFLAKSFPNQYRYPDRWEWLNLRNPFISDGFGLPEWIAIADGNIIGHTGAMLVPVKLDERTEIAGWSIDTFVSPAARGMGIGKKLQAANQSAHPLFMSLEMTPLNRAIKKRLGAREGPSVSLLYRNEQILLSPFSEEMVSALNRYLGFKKRCWEITAGQLGLLQTVCWIISKSIKARQRHATISTGVPSFTIEAVSRFDEQADELWATIRSRYTFAVERTSTYLNWKYCDQPHVRYDCFYIRGHGKTQGILVIRNGKPPEHCIGVICECYLRNPSRSNYAWAAQQAVSQLADQGFGGIWVATAEPQFEKVLLKQGFLRITHEPMMIHTDDDVNQNEKIKLRALIGKGDHDWDQFPRLRQPYLRQFVMLARGRL